MTTIAATQPQPPAPATPQPKAARPGAEYETFLQMLSVQLQNQDPLNPMESADFAVQLATFSGVEQQVKTNDLLEQMTGGGVQNTLARYAGWIGREVASPHAAPFDGAPLTVLPQVAPGASAARIEVLTEGGRVLQSLPVPLDGGAITWAGVGDGGAPLPAGSYRFATVSTVAGSGSETRAAQVYQPVRELRLIDGQPRLVLQSGAEVAPAEVSALREAGG